MRRLDRELYDAFALADRIEVTGIATSGVHGVYDDEAVDAQPFVVDVVIWTAFDEAVASDELDHTIDYVGASALVQEVVRTSRALLIERLADEICAAVLTNVRALGAQVTIHKPRAARDAHASDVCIRMARAR